MIDHDIHDASLLPDAAGPPTVLISAAGENAWRYLDPRHTVRGLWRHRELVWQLAWRELRQRYQGSLLGLAWTFCTPLLHLAVYTFVFQIVFRARWSDGNGESRLKFALALFCGLVFFSIFSEAVAVAPMVVLQGASFVKKTVFPLEVLPLVSLVQVLLRAGASLVILLAAILLLTDMGHWTIVLALLPVVPLVLITLGVSWFLAALGVFLRDISHAVTILVQVLFFLTPIVYPISNVPEPYRKLLKINPLTSLVEMMRGAAMWGRVPNLTWLMLGLLFSLLVFQLGYVFFMKSKHAFADVM
ncbi:MAG: ABC transporter permease [Thermoguttaceae bacterium]|jgi:lipopolysaccharide transport system permease protein